jgi:hypothetical protein
MRFTVRFYWDASQNSPEATSLYIKQYSNQSGLWGAASTSNIEILERFQSKALRMIVDAPLYVPNTVIRRDLQIPTVKEEIRRYSDRLCDLVVRVPGYRSRGPGSIPGASQSAEQWSLDFLPTWILVRIMSWRIYYLFTVRWPPLWSSGQSSWLQIRRPGFDSRHYQKKSSESGTGSTQPLEYNWGATW